MKPLVLTLKKKIKFRLDASFLTVNNIKNLTHIKNLKISYCKKKYLITDLFRIKGKDVKNIIIKSMDVILLLKKRLK